MSTGGFRLLTLAGVALAAAVLVAKPGTAVTAPKTHTIVINQMKFGPVPNNLQAGDVIVWVNRDNFKHTATARDRSFNVVLAPSARGKTVVNRRGALAFYCSYHPGMTGRLIVAGK